MSVFKLEQEIWDVEEIRVFFLNPHTLPTNHHSYKATYPEKLSGDSTAVDLVERIISCVGHGVEFGMVDAQLKQIHLYNFYKAEQCALN